MHQILVRYLEILAISCPVKTNKTEHMAMIIMQGSFSI